MKRPYIAPIAPINNNIDSGNLSKPSGHSVHSGHKSEIQVQAEAFQWAWNTYPATRRLLFHVPNGGSRNKIEGMQLKASGVVAGIPDLIFLWQGRMHAFELKTLTGTVSDVQAEVHLTWYSHGVTVHIVRTLERFQEIFKSIIS